MNKKCIDIQMAVLASDGEFSPDIEQHCSQCPECRAAMEDWNLLRTAGMEKLEVPVSADFNIIQAARDKANVFHRHRVHVRRLIGYTAAAASVAIACLVAVLENNAEIRQQKYIAGWDWNSFEKSAFELNTAAEYSSVHMTVGNNSNEDLENFVKSEFKPEPSLDSL
jgi:hypothetical protein